MTWREQAISVIDEVHQALPEDADIKTRRAALRAARPWPFEATSWGRKVWAAATRQYLEKHGLDPGHGRRKLPESPLERLMRRGASHDHE